MIFTPGNDYSAVLDACVLVPMALCDLLLRLAEEPAMYRPLWSEQILTEMAKALKTKLHRSVRRGGVEAATDERGVPRGNGHGAVRAAEGGRMHSRQRRQARAGRSNHGPR